MIDKKSRSMVEFTGESFKLISELKLVFNVKTNKAVLEKCLMLSSVITDEVDEKGTITIVQKDGKKLKLMIG